MQVNNIEEAARLYKRIEAAIEEKEKAFEEAVAPHKQALESLSTFMLSILNTSGVTSMNVKDVAEVRIVQKRTFSGADWDVFYNYVIANNCPELFIKRLHEENTQHWIDEHKGEIPPGINVITKNTLKLYKPK